MNLVTARKTSCDHCTTYCKCKVCKRERLLIRCEWYIRNIVTGFKTMFQRRPKRKVVKVRLSEIFTHSTYDTADSKYEWGILEKTIRKYGLKEPIHLIPILEVTRVENVIDEEWILKLVNGYKYFPLDGQHRTAVLKFIHLNDPLALVDACIIEPNHITDVSKWEHDRYPSDHRYFTAFYTPDTWDQKTDYAAVIHELNQR